MRPQAGPCTSRSSTALESKVIRQKLLDYGLSYEETMARLNTLSDGRFTNSRLRRTHSRPAATLSVSW